ncbi:hypothetical protein SAMN03159496_00826 [Rhizobium sp. NFR07]|uniref:hypothetical protein n=1 Tax=Rhizobium sp. NFR07 TaxID=1566262 RepID=UPI0008EB1012|nr:hypothetical protein [Rhizobium sp. NFR07]SFA90413.1 hypothetical protein SAMN03159496_00826 [Rhizobium sp. NFR07]
MLLPTQQSYGLTATNTMQSMLDGMEEQRRQDEEQRTGKERDKLTEARLSASEDAKRAREKIATALFGTGNADPAALKMDLVERLADELGLDTDEARSSYKLGRALEEALKGMAPNDVRALSEKIGFADLGISMDTLLNAIKNPYGDDNERLSEALIKKANGGKLGTEVERVVQRMEDTADPKSLDELKLGPQGYDPTRVEDAGTRAERLENIQAAEAGQKLEDVQENQDAVEEKNDELAANPTDDGAESVEASTSLAILAADAEKAEDAGEEGNDGILPVVTDEIGLYELRKKAA